MWSLIRSHWNDLISLDGGFALVWLDGLLFIPLVMAAFFFPLQAAVIAGAMFVVTLVAYEGWVFWRKRHPHTTHV